MIDQQLNPIQPPPSVDDLLALGSQARVGQVDFANRLVPATGGSPAPEPPSAPLATVTSVLPRQRPVAVVPELAVEPVAEPVAEAITEPEPEPVAEAVVEAEPEPPKAAPRSRPEPAAKRAAKTKAKRKPAQAPTFAEPVIEAETVVESPVTPAILPIADLSGESVSAAAHDDEFFASEVRSVAVHTDAAPTLRLPAPAVEDSAYLGGTVQEVADAAIERLRDAENASLQHLAALEAEATRRAELLTAQAELDAELIRITARREAHAIISAARTQAGLGAPSTRDARQLAEISDAVSRFAESIESSLAPMHPYSHQGDQA